MGRATSHSRLLHPRPLSLVLCLLPSALCFWSSALAQVPPRREAGANPAEAVVQLLAVGPGAGDKNRECSATGFFINAAGYILTNAHVVEEARDCLSGSAEAKIVAKFGGSDSQAEAVSCDLVGTDEAHDLAWERLWL
jgi:S1-C subfamily serine protease